MAAILFYFYDEKHHLIFLNFLIFNLEAVNIKVAKMINKNVFLL